MLLCRSFEDKELFLQRCKDTASDQRGFVGALDDDDLTRMVKARDLGDLGTIHGLLRQRFERLLYRHKGRARAGA